MAKIKEIKGKSRSIPFRINTKNDFYIQNLLRQREMANRNLLLNIVIEEHSTLEVYRAKAREKIVKLMADWNIRSSELGG